MKEDRPYKFNESLLGKLRPKTIQDRLRQQAGQRVPLDVIVERHHMRNIPVKPSRSLAHEPEMA